MFDLKTGQEIVDMAIKMKMQPYVADVDKRKVYEEKLTEFDKDMDDLSEQTKAVRVKRISWDYLENVRLAIPPTSYNHELKKNQQLDLAAFDKYLTIQEAEDEEPGETDDIKSPQMAVVKE